MLRLIATLLVFLLFSGASILADQSRHRKLHRPSDGNAHPTSLHSTSTSTTSIELSSSFDSLHEEFDSLSSLFTRKLAATKKTKKPKKKKKNNNNNNKKKTKKTKKRGNPPSKNENPSPSPKPPAPTPSPTPSPSPKPPTPSPTPTPTPKPPTPTPSPPLSPSTTSLPAPESPYPTPACADIGHSRYLRVNHTWQLENALEVVRAGDMIELSPGTYEARINIYNAIGSAQRPITICGPQSAVIAGKPNYEKNSYALTLVNSTYTRLVGFSVQYGLTGVILENTTYSMVVGLTINNTQNEGIRLRYGSKYNTIRNNNISLTGRPELGGWGGTGEGIYVGSSQKQMHSYGRYWLDRSDYNVFEYNSIGPGVLSEMIDVKEGCTGGIVRGNLFDGRHLTNLNGADSWMDIKGNNWTVTGNNGQYLKYGHGMGTSRKLTGWGRYNSFKDNNCLLYRFGSKSSAGDYCVVANTVPESQIIDCSNVAIGATKGVTNVRTCPGDAQLSGGSKKRRMTRRSLLEETSAATSHDDGGEDEVFWTHHIDETLLK